MTEAEWLVCEDAREMLICLRKQHRSHGKKSSKRKLKLFGCASCRDRWHLLKSPKSKACIEAAEALADGLRIKRDPDAIRKAALDVWRSTVLANGMTAARSNAEHDVTFLLWSILQYQYTADAALQQDDEGDRVSKKKVARLRVLAGYLRDIFGNPFRPITFPSSWRTEHTVGIAAKMYEERNFAAMPILADALEEAGCDSADILSHCREPGAHVRGCWVVDLVLGKA